MSRKKQQEHARVIVLTAQQRAIVHELIASHLEDRGSIHAQVYSDGIRVRVLTPEQTTDMRIAFQHSLGQELSEELQTSVFAVGSRT